MFKRRGCPQSEKQAEMLPPKAGKAGGDTEGGRQETSTWNPNHMGQNGTAGNSASA